MLQPHSLIENATVTQSTMALLIGDAKTLSSKVYASKNYYPHRRFIPKVFERTNHLHGQDPTSSAREPFPLHQFLVAFDWMSVRFLEARVDAGIGLSSWQQRRYPDWP